MIYGDLIIDPNIVALTLFLIFAIATIGLLLFAWIKQ